MPSSSGQHSQTYLNYIEGNWVGASTGKTYSVLNPANTNAIVGNFQESGPEDAQKAIMSAHKAFTSWRKTPPPLRASILFKAWQLMRERQNEIAKTITLEEGKPIKDALGEVKRTINVLEFTAGEGRRMYGQTMPSELTKNFTYTIRKPLGVVAIISPWNFPLSIPVWKIAPALICGNTIVFKPATGTPLTAVVIMELFIDAGLPKGVLNLVTGPGRKVGEELIKHPLVKGISFTGSNEIGATVYDEGSKRMKKVQCEMGGKNAVVVLQDADMELAVEGIVQGAFGSTGQRCTATSRVVVEEKVYEAFIEKIVTQVKKLKVGNGSKADVDMGPLASESQFKKVLGHIATGKEEGATLLLGGNPMSGPEYGAGYFVDPTIFTDVSQDMSLAQEEVFGPVLSVVKAKDFDDAVDIANNVKFGLSSSIYTRDIGAAFQFIDEIDVGMVHVNSPTLGGEAQMPFGGTKASGMGTREQATTTIDFFTELVSVYIDYTGMTREAKFI